MASNRLLAELDVKINFWMERVKGNIFVILFRKEIVDADPRTKVLFHSINRESFTQSFCSGVVYHNQRLYTSR